MPDPGRLWRTLRYLRVSQLWYLARYRLLVDRHVTPLPTRAVEATPLALATPPLAAGADCTAKHFRFLNQSMPASLPVDWHPEGPSKLWRYNLHYLDYLLNPAIDLGTRNAWLDDWVAHNAPPAEDAWEPYTVSLRLVNWLKFIAINGQPEQGRVERERALYRHAAWLEHHIEYHLRANHLLKNGKALMFAGAAFSGEDGRRWFRLGLDIMREAIAEQMLEDGGHFERSPMYHCIVLEDLLDLANLVVGAPGLASVADPGAFRDAAMAGMRFLERVLLPGERLPLFNDSANGIAPPPAQLRDYAARVLGQTPAAPTRSGPWREALRQSGYYLMGRDADALMIDCGQIGPDHQPGHAHCDALSVEWVLDGRAVLTDTGVGSYQPLSERPLVRGTAAHNTLMLDGVEQSEIWGGFRVGRRARPMYADLGVLRDGGSLFRGAHDGYRHLSGAPVHEREIRFDGARRWHFTDRLNGGGEHQVALFWHFAPGLVLQRDGAEIIVSRGGEPIVLARVPGQLALEVDTSPYFPAFGERQERASLRLTGRIRLPAVFETVFEKR